MRHIAAVEQVGWQQRTVGVNRNNRLKKMWVVEEAKVTVDILGCFVVDDTRTRKERPRLM